MNRFDAGASRRGFLTAGVSLAAGAGLTQLSPSESAAQGGSDAELARLQAARRVLLQGGVVLTLDPQAGDFARAVRTIRRLRQLDPHDPFQERDLGASLLHAGQPGKAIDHLAGYLKSLPAAEDAEAVQKLLRRARAELAKWN